MGNCLKSPTSDDISLLHESQSDRASYGEADPDLEPPPPYQEEAHMPVYHPTPSQARLASQLTEEEQVRIAQRIGLIQHLPRGVYDGGRDGSEKKIREFAILNGSTAIPNGLKKWMSCMSITLCKVYRFYNKRSSIAVRQCKGLICACAG
ncbi:RING finger protein 11-like isoform X2 [Salmo trutta]|uniref:Ring finger protein 11 n=1 Tax=Salmo trutta TaxID=8032 RepID=A0A673W4A1_SALTR|nr:RING finger protein 11-like isoform X2 [Salmo trutta]